MLQPTLLKWSLVAYVRTERHCKSFLFSCGIVVHPRFACPHLSVLLQVMFQSTWHFQLTVVYFTQGMVVQRQFLRHSFRAFNRDLFPRNCRLLHLSVLFAVHLSKMSYSWLCILPQALLLCAKHCLSPLHTCWEIMTFASDKQRKIAFVLTL